MSPDGKPYGLKDQIYRQSRAGSPNCRCNHLLLSGGRLIEAGGDVGSRLMIEAVAHNRTEPGLRGCRFFFIDYADNCDTMRNVILTMLLTCCLLTACYNEGKLVVNPAPLAQYQFKPTEARLLETAKAYADAINQNLDQRAVHPGLYADYGVALARLGCLEQANTMFNNEKAFFPNSTLYVDYLIATFTPRQAGDKHIDTSHIDLKTLDTIRITLTPEEESIRRQLENDPEYQKLLKQQMKEEKEQKAIETKKAKKEQAKAKEKERKEKIKAKEQAKREKEAAKKAAEKAKKQEAREAEKAKREADRAKKKEAKS